MSLCWRRLNPISNNDLYISIIYQKVSKYLEVLNEPDTQDSKEFKFKKEPNGNDILKCANKFYKSEDITIPKNHDYINLKKEKKKTFNYAYNDEPLELSNLLYSIFNQQKYRYKIHISFSFTFRP